MFDQLPEEGHLAGFLSIFIHNEFVCIARVL